MALALPRAVNIYADESSGTPVYTAQTASDGAFTLPATVKQGTYGSHTLVAVGQTSGALGVTSFAITPLLQVSPTSGTVGTTLSASGYGFGANEQVQIWWNNPHTLMGTVTTNSLGSFYGATTLRFTVPAGTLPGQNVVYAYGLTSRAARTVLVNVLPSPPTNTPTVTPTATNTPLPAVLVLNRYEWHQRHDPRLHWRALWRQ